MNDAVRRTTFGLLLLAACVAAGARAQFTAEPDPTETSVSGDTAESIILTWPTYSYRLARAMIAKYGQPSEIRYGSLTWVDNGPWKKTVVHREPPKGRVFKRKGRLEQSAAYRAPPARLQDLAAYDREIEAEDGLLTVRSDSESENFAALNLADEVVRGKRSPQNAAAFRERLSSMAAAGKSSKYLEGLLFAPDAGPDPESPD